MIIVTNGLIQKQHFSGFQLMINNLVAELALQQPLHSFVVLAGKGQLPVVVHSNITIYPVNSLFRRLFGEKAWCRHVLPHILQKLRADLLLSAGDLYSPVNRLPSFLFLPPLEAADKPGETGSKRFSKRFEAACRRSRAVITFSGNDQQHLQARFPACAQKIIHLRPSGSRMIRPLAYAEREQAKASHARGLEYFAFAGELHERHLLTVLLKAFSLFKKWQRSNMQLVVTGNSTPQTAAWLETLSSYKYRADVHIVPDPAVQTVRNIIGGAYAFVHPATAAHTPVNIIYAMQAGVPVIASGTAAVEEVAGGAVMYTAQNSEAAFAQALKALYNDEQLRDGFVARGLQQAAAAGSRMAEDCWLMLEELSNLKS